MHTQGEVGSIATKSTKTASNTGEF